MQKSFRRTNSLWKFITTSLQETRSKVKNKIVLPRYSKSKCQKALIFCGIKLWNTISNDIKQLSNLAWFRKYLQHFIVSCSDSPDWWVPLVLTHSYIMESQIIIWSSSYVSYFSNCIIFWLVKTNKTKKQTNFISYQLQYIEKHNHPAWMTIPKLKKTW